MRQIFIDTETTGLHPHQGHRIIEIACVEVINRTLTGHNFHTYINPEREIDEGAFKVHGISSEMIKDSPKFKDIVESFIQYLYNPLHDFYGSADELIMHNAKFDVGFINNEFRLLQKERVQLSKWDEFNSLIPTKCTVEMSRSINGQSIPNHKLDTLKKCYGINLEREKHGALIDAEILAQVYLKMTEKWYL